MSSLEFWSAEAALLRGTRPWSQQAGRWVTLRGACAQAEGVSLRHQLRTVQPANLALRVDHHCGQQRVSEQVVNQVNRWREDSNSRGRDPTTGLRVSEVYMAVRSSVDAAPVYSLSHYHFPGGFYGWHTLSWRQQLHASLIIVEELETRGPSAVGATEYTLAEVSETDYTILGSCGFL